MVAKWLEAKGDGGNIKLGFKIALITIQRLAMVFPRPHANYLHAVGNLYSPDEKSSRQLFQSLRCFEGSTITLSPGVNLAYTLW